MAIPSDYGTGNFGTTQSTNASINGVTIMYLTNSDRLFIVNVPASFATGKAVVRTAYLMSSTSDVYYGSSNIGVLDQTFLKPKRVGFGQDGSTEVIIYSGENGVYRTYARSAGNIRTGSNIFRRDNNTVRTYTGISGFFTSPSTVGEGTVGVENKIYLNNSIPSATGTWQNVQHNGNVNGNLDEDDNYTIKKRLCDDSATVEYITDDGESYAPESLIRYSVTPPSNFPAKITSAGSNAIIWICSKDLNKISLSVNRQYTDSTSIVRPRGEVLIENTIANKTRYSPVSMSIDLPYNSSQSIVTYRPVQWICMYIGCTDGYIRYVCWNVLSCVSIVKDDRGCLWTTYDAQPVN